MLNKSIIRVEQPDVQLEAHADALATLPEPPLTEQQAAGVGDDTEAASRCPLTLSFEDYQRLGRLLVGRLQQLEERCGIISLGRYNSMYGHRLVDTCIFNALQKRTAVTLRRQR